MALTYNNTKIAPEIAGDEPKYQSHLTSTAVCDSDDLAADVAASTKHSVNVVSSVLNGLANAVLSRLKEGFRVSLENIGSFNLYAEGAFASADAAWDPSLGHRIVCRFVPSDAIKMAAADLIPENVLKPVTVRVLGVQDKDTFEQNVLHTDGEGLIQGVGLRITTANEDEGVYLVAGETEVKMTVTASTAGTIDFEVPDGVNPQTYELQVRSRDGNGTNRMLVIGRMAQVEVKN